MGAAPPRQLQGLGMGRRLYGCRARDPRHHRPARAAVAEAGRRPASKGCVGTHLGAALYHLSHVANPGHYDVAEELANVVVVAEVAVGTWRADPDDLRRGLFESSETTGVMFIAGP